MKNEDRDIYLELVGSEEDLRDARRLNRFYDKMRKSITNWAAKQGGQRGQRVAEVILLAPDFFILLTRLMQDSRVPLRSRASIIGSLAYFLLPLDFIPELILGPLGYSDDLVLAVIIINNLLKAEPEVVLSHWSGNEHLLVKIQKVTGYTEQYLNKGVYTKLKSLFGRFK
ncbi:MAG: DUF1232 domain-containing protein [Carboxydocellales bacterium]